MRPDIFSMKVRGTWIVALRGVLCNPVSRDRLWRGPPFRHPHFHQATPFSSYNMSHDVPRKILFLQALTDKSHDLPFPFRQKSDFMNRRKFLYQTGLLAAGTLTLGWAGCNTDAPATEAQQEDQSDDKAAGGTLEAFGIQLWTLRDEMAKDPREVLRQVASFGYSQIENYEGPQGLWWGMSHKEFKQQCDELGLALVASHCNFVQDFEAKAAQAAEVGMKYLVAPWVGPQKSIDDFRRIAETFNRCGEICQQHGLRFAYHNHDFEFIDLEGQRPYDLLLAETDPELVQMELDLYWITKAGFDPMTYFEQHPGRFPLCHVKDMAADGSMVDVGAGTIDFAAIFAHAGHAGLRHYFVEHDNPADPLASITASFEFLNDLTF